jgi:transmembrane sensor
MRMRGSFMVSTETLSEETLEAAAAWYERLHQELVSADTQRAYAAWLAQSDDHKTAYESVNNTWRRVQGAASDAQILALRHETALRLTRRASAAIRPLHWTAAAVVLIVLCGAAATLGGWLHSDRLALSGSPAPVHEQTVNHYATAIGERLAVTLSDGSQVTLDTQSELSVAFTPSERVVRLLRGQAYLKVAKNHQRPFVVEALNRRIVAVGTAFDVRVDGTQVRVAMVEGTVRVEHREEPADAAGTSRATPIAAVTITAGEELLADAAVPDRVGVSDPERSTSWLRGQIFFDNARLADAVAELNRYSNTKIELADPKIAQLHLSGAFATGRSDLFVEALTSYFPVQAVSSGDHLVVLSAKH